MQLGATFAALSAKSEATHLQFSGSGPALGVALGKSVRANLAVYGAFMLASSIDPRFKMNGVATPTVSGSTDLVLFGVGAAYYLEPANVFLAATIGVSKLDFQDNQKVVLYESQWGLGGELVAGKEWWVSDEWGIGVSGQLLLATASGKGVLAPGESSPTWTGAAFSVLFSSTYN
jgi:hypothetical protein